MLQNALMHEIIYILDIISNWCSFECELHLDSEMESSFYVYVH